MDILAPLFDRIGGPRRALVLLVGLGAAALIFGVSRWASEPNWVPAFTGVPLESVGQMTDKLDQAGVKYKLERGGADVTIVDDSGRMLSEAVEADSPMGLTSRQLTMQREIEDYLRGKAAQIVGQIVGTNNVRVQVAAAMSFDRVERTTATVDPDKQV